MEIQNFKDLNNALYIIQAEEKYFLLILLLPIIIATATDRSALS